MAAKKQTPPAPARLYWTAERPTAPGWYWHRGLGEDTDALIVLVDDAGYFQWPDGGFSEAAQTDGQWAGPLEPPTDLG
ncbi:MAG: hypothetical protein U0172_07615 [Nitrospiraceae bacterium]